MYVAEKFLQLQLSLICWSTLLLLASYNIQDTDCMEVGGPVHPVTIAFLSGPHSFASGGP